MAQLRARAAQGDRACSRNSGNSPCKGSVVDLAVGLIIGTAFGAIVKSLVDDIIMPIDRHRRTEWISPS